MEAKKMTYEELDGKVAVFKSEIFALNFKAKKIQEEILQKENALKKLREVKWLKICDDLKAKVIEANVDFSLDDVQAFLQAKHSTKPKRKAKNLKE